MKRTRKPMIKLLVVAIIGFSVGIHADTIHVPADYATIQAGIDAATHGDTVLVADGTYSGAGNYNISLKEKILVLASENGYESCVIDCGQLGSGVNAGPSGSIIQGFSIIHASEEIYDAAVIADNGGTIVDCVLKNNRIGVLADQDNGGICVLKNCIIYENTAFDIYASFKDVHFVNTIVIGNVYADVVGVIDFFNCYVGGIIFAYCDAEMSFYNCTIQCPIETYMDNVISVKNSIVWPGSLIEGYNVTFNVTYSNIQGGFTGFGNIDVDPLFVHGPLGAFYLSSIAAGQQQDSPCIDAGSDLAATICDPWQNDPLYMSEMTTRTDQIVDDEIVDMGFHYLGPVPPTATPSPTFTPEPTSSPVAEGVDLTLNKSEFQAGDPFDLRVTCTGSIDRTVDLYVVLNVIDSYWFYPDWEQTPSYETFMFSEQQVQHKHILNFKWPEDDFGQADGIHFFCVMCCAGTTDLLGELDFVTFGYR
ncbi:hypothetical protein K8T06_11680 [bacterium]|nr:hypothetical protein [bacterium]